MMGHLVTIENITYQFSVDGAVDSLLEISPGIDTPIPNMCINKIPVSILSNDSDKCLAIGSEAVITGTTLKIIKPSQYKPICLEHTVCPVCGSLLFTDGVSKFCINKECIGQLTTNTLMMTHALGLLFTGVNLRIFDALMSDSRVRTPSDIFKIDVVNSYSHEIPVLDLQLFQQYLHGIRGNVTIEQVLRGFNIRGLSESFILKVSLLFKNNGYTLLNGKELLYPEFLCLIKDENLEPWMTFISIAQNRRQLLEMCNILYI